MKGMVTMMMMVVIRKHPTIKRPFGKLKVILELHEVNDREGT